MEDLRCQDCKVFQEKYGCRVGGGEKCLKDTFKRKKIYARDYACNNVVKVEGEHGD